MSETKFTTCELVMEAESSAREARKKGDDDWSSPLALAYYQVSLELRRIVSRHVLKGKCAACREDELRRPSAEFIRDLASNAIHSLADISLGIEVPQ
jgi:hypothetical protein